MAQGYASPTRAGRAASYPDAETATRMATSPAKEPAADPTFEIHGLSFDQGRPLFVSHLLVGWERRPPLQRGIYKAGSAASLNPQLTGEGAEGLKKEAPVEGLEPIVDGLGPH